jgi:hypothetical protein
MLVASSNNKAVENVSAELPGLKAIATDAGELRYFATVSDALRGEPTWGLVAAVLGNAANRSKFKQTFWWDEDRGLSTYLAAAAGTPQWVEVQEPESDDQKTRPPLIVTAENPPQNHEEALRRWRKARSAFRVALAKSREILQELGRARELSLLLPELAKGESRAAAAADEARGAEDRARAAVAAARERLTVARQGLTAAEARLAEHDAMKPGFLQRLFQSPQQQSWQSERLKRLQVRNQAAEMFERLSADVARCEQRLLDAPAECAHSERKLSEARERYASARREVAAARERLASRFVDPGFFQRDHAEQHMATPWLDAADQRIRDDVFVSAMALHKAFIDAAAKPLRHNLGALMSGFSRTSYQDERATLADLWASFFLVVPLVSTTFASTERMLGALPPKALGWLFVDEAGQALPQAAVGALMRTRRAVVVGDPMQIQPVVVLPEVLTTTICRHFGVDPDRFNAPSASVQTLADAATPYVAEFEGRSGCRTVGVPLLVHRRCAEPMFGISNSIAYQRLMVNAKVRGPSRIREVLGPSAWLNVQGNADGKWCPEEGALTVELLRRLSKAGVNPDLYIVTPFVMVAENLRRVVRESRVLEGWTNRSPWQWTSERIGTVHTVQGREAEAVVLVLGAPALEQEGARGWAGQRVNLLNVAVTPAKEQLYVIGNRSLWRGFLPGVGCPPSTFMTGRVKTAV